MSDTEVKAEETQVREPELLSLRDALEVAHETEKEANVQGDESAVVADDKRDNQGAPVVDSGADGAVRNNKPPVEVIEPPARWKKEAKEAFFKMDAIGRQAALEVDRHQNESLEEIKRGKEDLKRDKEELAWATDLAKEAKRFYQARGEAPPTPKDFINALAVVNDLKGTQSSQSIAAILEARGLPIPKGLLESDDSEKKVTEDILSPVQKRLEILESERAQEKAREFQANSQKLWQTFEAEKNAAGAPKYADAIGDSESALRLSSLIGSLVHGHHEQSTGFAAYVKARIPQAEQTPVRILEEAYIWLGGKVAEAEAPKTQDPQKHLKQSNRAAASSPGRGTSGGSSGVVKTYKTTREALAAAMAEQNN